MRLPLERFRSAGFLRKLHSGLVQLRPDELHDCAPSEVRSSIQRCCAKVLRRYYEERVPNG